MGYIKKVVDTGVQFAESYQMPEYVTKARESSKIIDVASEKIEKIYCEKGSPLLELVDEFTAAKINTALDITSKKVEQAQKLKIAAADKVHLKTTEAIELAKQTKATAYEKTSTKYTAFKIEASKKVDDTKTILRNRYAIASEEACRLEEFVDKKLKEKAATNEYANKVLSVVMTAKKQVKFYGEAIVQKSLSLPLTLQERMENGLSLSKEKVEVVTMTLKEKYQIATVKLFVINETCKGAMGKYYGKMTKANALSSARSVFGEKAVVKAQTMLQDLKKAEISEKVSDKMKGMYTYSAYQVGKFAKIAEKYEEKYFGTDLVFKAQAKFAGK
jgi:hypothetical protein